MLIAILTGANLLAFGGKEEAAAGRRCFGKLLTAIGFENLMNGLAAIVLHWGIVRAVHRPRMTMFRSVHQAS